MKKNMILAAAAAASTILLSLSCTKQDNVQSLSRTKVFTASIEQIQTKTTLGEDGLKVNWSEGDRIIIMGKDERAAIYSATPMANSTAEFTKVKGDEPQVSPYSAIYPVELYQGKLSFPSIQKYEPGKLNAPMFAYSETEELRFKNMCGVVCFALTGSVEIGRIELWADGIALCGPFEVNHMSEKVTTIGDPSENNRVILRCDDDKKKGVQLDANNPTYFYIYVPETKEIPATNLHAKICGMNDGCYELRTHSNVTIERNNIYTFEFDINGFDSEESQPVAATEVIEIFETQILPGEFTVDANGTKVKFTSGNVVYSSKYGWECEMDQGRIIKPFENEKDSVNLFLWHDNPDQSRLGQATTAPATRYLFCDGHKYVFVPEETDIRLSVPSMAQWNYILFERSVNDCFAKARYGGMPGLLLFPDELDAKVSEIVKKYQTDGGISTSNEETASFPDESKNIIDVDFAVLIENGCVFLPAEATRGYKNNEVGVDGGLGENANGYYWGVCDGGFAILQFDGKSVCVQGGAVDDEENWELMYKQALGASIRLVQVIPAAQEVQEAEVQEAEAQGNEQAAAN